VLLLGPCVDDVAAAVRAGDGRTHWMHAWRLLFASSAELSQTAHFATEVTNAMLSAAASTTAQSTPSAFDIWQLMKQHPASRSLFAVMT
jgi:hypothetical protein